jgi:hypothetical protein
VSDATDAEILTSATERGGALGARTIMTLVIQLRVWIMTPVIVKSGFRLRRLGTFVTAAKAGQARGTAPPIARQRVNRAAPTACLEGPSEANGACLARSGQDLRHHPAESRLNSVTAFMRGRSWVSNRAIGH